MAMGRSGSTIGAGEGGGVGTEDNHQVDDEKFDDDYKSKEVVKEGSL